MSQQQMEYQSPLVSDQALGSTEALAVVTHKLRTPLAIISGYVQLLLSYKLGSLNEQQRQVLEACDHSCNDLQSFIGNFLTFARQDSGKMEMYYEAGDIIEVFSEIHSLFLPRFREKGVTFEFQAISAVPNFPFDEIKTQQVAIALLENALKFTPPMGSVAFTVGFCGRAKPGSNPGKPEQIERSGSTAISDCVRVSISDTGPGIDPEHHQTIFEAFVKVRQSSGQAEGAGLGLAIARRLVEAQGGRIWVESSPGLGSNFIFLLPLVRPAPQAKSA